MSVIRFENVTKGFPRRRGHRLLREHLASFMRGANRDRFFALNHVSFSVEEGDSLGVVGHNGAGKSTVLGLIAGLTKPDSGRVEVQGRVAALLELGSGFHHDLTGRENVRLNASLLGLSRQETEERFSEIVDFSGIGEFINEPLRTYSSGMVMRLAFAIAVAVDPDILLIDEVLAVGDTAFQLKCFNKIRQFRQSGKSLVCVSHAVSMVSELCSRAIWLDHGQLIMAGEVKGVLAAYTEMQTPTSPLLSTATTD